MIALPDLIIIANDRLSDAEALYFAGRYSAAAYLSGYAIEVALKHKICITLNWSEFPQTNAEFKNYGCLKTHNLTVLLHFSGVETQIKDIYFEYWSAFDKWTPEIRYNSHGSINEIQALSMITSAKKLIQILWKK